MIDKKVTELPLDGKRWELEYLDMWGYIGEDGKLILDEDIVPLDECLTNLHKAVYFTRQLEEGDGKENDYICELVKQAIRSIQSRYKNMIDRTVIDYHPNGQKKSESSYRKSGKKEGLETWWFENGQKSSEATFQDGVRKTDVTSWDEDGTPMPF